MTEEITGSPAENLDDNPLNIGSAFADVPLSPAVAVGAIALNMALKYADISTVQEGALYQQYKLEGKNLQGLHLDMVFEYAKRIEQHLMTTPNRLSETVYGTLLEALAADDEAATGAPDQEGRVPYPEESQG